MVSIATETKLQTPDRMRESLATAFHRDGFVGPLPLFSIEQCHSILARLNDEGQPPPAVWFKGHAVSDRFLYEIATLPRLLALVTELLGDSFVLWGCHAVKRSPGRIHPWHTDIESSAADGRFVSVWVGLENTSRDSALRFISRSHTFGKTIQQIAYEKGVSRELVSKDVVSSWAQEIHPGAGVVQHEMSDGQALFFDGRLWHGSENTRSEGARRALILQYAAADTPLRMPDLSHLDWPFRFKEARVPTILVRGESPDGINWLVAPPPKDNGSTEVAPRVHKLSLPLGEDPVKRWKPYSIFKGSTPTFDHIRCHASILSPGHSPHPPHSHADEELLIPLSGDADIIISDSPSTEGARVERLRRGSFVYYPAFQHHTIYNPGNSPVTYLMFKWRRGASGAERALDTTILRFADIASGDTTPFKTQRIFQGPTDCLSKLHAHMSKLRRGGGYAPHIDPYDVAIVVLAGRMETLGQIAEPHDVIYYPAGHPHGMRNLGDEPARYLVFEFHSPHGSNPAKKTSRSVQRQQSAAVSITARELVRNLLARLGLLAEARRIMDALRRLRSKLGRKRLG